jgi:Ca2+-dependent lipid-binding protein
MEATANHLTLTVYDEDMLSSDIVGTCTIPLSTLCRQVDEWFIIQYKGKNAGKVHLKCNYLVQDIDMQPIEVLKKP